MVSGKTDKTRKAERVRIPRFHGLLTVAEIGVTFNRYRKCLKSELARCSNGRAIGSRFSVLALADQN